MNCIIPFTKDIKFTSNISEILSISLEHDYTLNESDLLGNFIISGDYKTHEVSVNKEHFEYSLPFSVALSNRIDADTLDFNIEDFTYEIVDHDTLRVDIEYSLKAHELPKEEEELFERVDMDKEKAEEIIEESSEEVKKEVELDNVLEEVEGEEEPVIEETSAPIDLEVRGEDTVVQEEKEEEIPKETVLNSINSDDNTFVTYHIHILKENETIETVCTMYNTPSSLISEYNDLSNLTLGSKIIIPDIDE